MANCAYRITKNGSSYGIAINVADTASASNRTDYNDAALYINGNSLTMGSIDLQGNYIYVRWKKNIGNKDITGLLSFTSTSSTALPRFQIYEYANDTEGNQLTNGPAEIYRLPIVSSAITTHTYYSILTSKNLVTIDQGGTGLADSPSMLVNLGSTTAADILVASPRPGITGTLGAGHGGTGQTTLKLAATSLLQSLDQGSSTPVDGDVYISSYANGSGYETSVTYYRRKVDSLFDYMKGKFGTAATHAHGDYVQTTGDQSVAGQKTFTGVIVPQNTVKIQNSSSPGIQFHANASGLQYYGNMFFNYSTTSTYRRPHSFYFREFTYNSTTGVVDTSKFEDYHLPVVNADRSAVATYNILTTKEYSLPTTWRAATADTSGVVTTGAQTFAGNKTINGYVSANGNVYVRENNNSVAGGLNCIYASTVTNAHTLTFYQYSYNTDGSRTSHYDRFYLPSTAVASTSDVTYYILTTKNLVTVAQGGTGQAAIESSALTYTTNSHITSAQMSANMKVLKFGKVGMLVSTGASLAAYSYSGWVKIGSVPAAYKPAMNATNRIPVSDTNWRIQIDTDGNVNVYKSTSDTTLFYCSFAYPLA